MSNLRPLGKEKAQQILDEVSRSLQARGFNAKFNLTCNHGNVVEQPDPFMPQDAFNEGPEQSIPDEVYQQEYTIGDTVELKSGGPRMTVTNYGKFNGWLILECSFFPGACDVTQAHYGFQSVIIPAKAVRLIEEAGNGN